MKAIQNARKSGRRGFAFALVAALAVTACGGSDDASNTAEDSATEETTAPVEETAKSTT